MTDIACASGRSGKVRKLTDINSATNSAFRRGTTVELSLRSSVWLNAIIMTDDKRSLVRMDLPTTFLKTEHGYDGCCEHGHQSNKAPSFHPASIGCLGVHGSIDFLIFHPPAPRDDWGPYCCCRLCLGLHEQSFGW